MLKAVRQMLLAAIAALLPWTTEVAAQSTCAPNWTANHYKSFGAVQNEIKKQFGEVRILRVALCGEGGDAYFQIVIISGQGEVRRVQIAASNGAPG